MKVRGHSRSSTRGLDLVDMVVQLKVVKVAHFIQWISIGHLMNIKHQMSVT